jgi:hypothetical protein
MLGGFSRPAIDAVLTMWPSYEGFLAAASSIIGVKTRMPWATPMTLTPSTHAQSAAVFLPDQAAGADAGVVEDDVRRAEARLRRRAERLDLGRMGDVEPDRQHVGASARTSAAARSSASCCTSAMTTFMPRFAARREVSRPNPEPAPVMTAVPPLNVFMRFPSWPP